MKKQPSKKLEFLRHMPPLRHSIPGREFDIMKSEVMDWIMAQPEIREYVFTKVTNFGSITFNNSTKTWQGVDYKPMWEV